MAGSPGSPAPAAAMARLERSLAIREFLDRAGWRGAHRAHLTGDASARILRDGQRGRTAPAILMNSPPLVLGPPVRGGKAYAEIAHTARSVSAFVAIDRAAARGRLRRARDPCAGSRPRASCSSRISAPAAFSGRTASRSAERYEAAAELLADLHDRPWPAQRRPRRASTISSRPSTARR